MTNNTETEARRRFLALLIKINIGSTLTILSRALKAIIFDKGIGVKTLPCRRKTLLFRWNTLTSAKTSAWMNHNFPIVLIQKPHQKRN